MQYHNYNAIHHNCEYALAIIHDYWPFLPQSLSDQLSTATATGNVDEELVRTNTKALLELWVLKAKELLDSIDQESDLLEKMKEMSSGRLPDPSQPPPAPHRTSNGPLKPFVITQEMLRVIKWEGEWESGLNQTFSFRLSC